MEYSIFCLGICVYRFVIFSRKISVENLFIFSFAFALEILGILLRTYISTSIIKQHVSWIFPKSNMQTRKKIDNPIRVLVKIGDSIVLFCYTLPSSPRRNRSNVKISQTYVQTKVLRRTTSLFLSSNANLHADILFLFSENSRNCKQKFVTGFISVWKQEAVGYFATFSGEPMYARDAC